MKTWRFADLPESGSVRLVGWIRRHGEMEFYKESGPMAKNSGPLHCISGVLADEYTPERLRWLDSLERSHVVLEGRVIDYETLPDEDRPLIPRKTLESQVVPNWCFGSKVLLIERLTPVN